MILLRWRADSREHLPTAAVSSTTAPRTPGSLGSAHQAAILAAVAITSPEHHLSGIAAAARSAYATSPGGKLNRRCPSTCGTRQLVS
jgi:hypothetical protein